MNSKTRISTGFATIGWSLIHRLPRRRGLTKARENNRSGQIQFLVWIALTLILFWPVSPIQPMMYSESITLNGGGGSVQEGHDQDGDGIPDADDKSLSINNSYTSGTAVLLSHASTWRGSSPETEVCGAGSGDERTQPPVVGSGRSASPRGRLQ